MASESSLRGHCSVSGPIMKWNIIAMRAHEGGISSSGKGKSRKKGCTAEEARAGCSSKELSPITCLFPLGSTFCFSPSPNNGIILRICQRIHPSWGQSLNDAIVSRNVSRHTQRSTLWIPEAFVCSFPSFNCILIYSLRIPYNIFWSHVPLLPPLQPLPGCLHHISLLTLNPLNFS